MFNDGGDGGEEDVDGLGVGGRVDDEVGPDDAEVEDVIEAVCQISDAEDFDIVVE